MSKLVLRFVIANVLLLLTGQVVIAQGIKVLTEEYPPYNMMVNGQIAGFSTELIKKAFGNARVPYTLHLMNWDVAIKRAQDIPNTCVYSTNRTEEREPLFKWVGPIAHSDWLLFGRSDSPHITSAEDAKKYTIGIYPSDAVGIYLKEHGFKVDVAPEDKLNPTRLMNKQIDFWASGTLQGPYVAEHVGVRGLLPVLTIRESLMYLACSKATSDELVARLNAAIRELFINNMNQNTISLVIDNSSGSYLQIADDMATVLNDGNNLRILPTLGSDPYQTVRDVRFLKGVDLGLTQINVLNHFRRTHELGNIDDKIVYVAKLFNEEFHLLVRSDITSIEQLRGKKVNLGVASGGSQFSMYSGTQFTARDLLRALNIQVNEVSMNQADAIEKMRAGEIDGTILVTGKPAPILSKLQKSDGFHLLPIPYVQELVNDYLPTVLSEEDYPGLIPPGQHIDTIAAECVLIAYNWPKNSDRYRRIEAVVQALIKKIDSFREPPRHVKWRETNLWTTVRGWTRFDAAERPLADAASEGTSSTNSQSYNDFMQFLNSHGYSGRMTSEQRAKLFDEFNEFVKRGQQPMQ
jgi:TRAP-type uncharacterized transport system substrate-binding protein